MKLLKMLHSQQTDLPDVRELRDGVCDSRFSSRLNIHLENDQ